MNTPVAYEDAMQILEDPKAAAWELRDLAKSLLAELQVAKAAEREQCSKISDELEAIKFKGYYDGDKP